MPDKTINRRLVKLVHARAGEEPVILLEGPRASGKSTTIRALADLFNVRVIDFDNQIIRDDAARDPVFYTADESITLIDEYQRVPAILDAIKTRLNLSGRPGQFILTGSTRHDAMAGSVQALTGRLHKMRLFPFAQSEIEGTAPDLLTKLIEDPAGTVSSKRTRPSKQPVFDTRESYIKRILYGGFPLAVTRAERPRNRWFDDYIRQTVERDIPGIARIRNKRGLLQLLRRLASQTAQILSVESAAKDAAVDVATARDYIQLLEDVFMIYKLPSWGRTLGSRITAKPKIHVLDSGIAARLLGLSSEKLSAKEPAALTEFGHLIETFTVAEILKELSWLDDSFLTGHWRTHGGDEVDFVVEKMDGSVYGFEIKSSGRAAGDVFDGLAALRKFAGSSFKGGFVFYTGTQSFRADDRLFALPICSLWRA